MPDFDPYHKWLGISPQHQPPNHYRLLSLDLYESDADVIEASVDRIVAYLQDVAAGPQANESQKLLNEVATARICLLDESHKSAYDKKLNAELAQAIWPPEEERDPAPAPPVAPGFAIDTSKDSSLKSLARKPATTQPIVTASPKRPASSTGTKKSRRTKQKFSPALLFSFVFGGVMFIAIGLVMLARGNSESKRRAAEETRIRERQESFVEMGRQAESMIPDFEANFHPEAAPAAKKSKNNRRKNKTQQRN